jgi:pimeloyl-ACP methyl ester carboxylesterase
MSRFRASLALAVAALLAGCTGPAAPPASPSPVAVPGRSMGGQPLTQCTIGGTDSGGSVTSGLCGTLTVPEDRGKPSGRQVSLQVAVIPALAADPAPQPLFALAGGPGGAGTRQFGWLPSVFVGIHATRDIVLVDQRGTGNSNQLIMPPLPDTTGLADAQASAALASWAADYFGSLDADPTMYTSTVAADDLDDVRAALGYDQIDLYGPSYGATLAQYYLRQHGDHVHVAVMDGGTPLDVPIFERLPANSQHALDLLFDRCAADPACAGAFPQLRDEWASVLDSLATPVDVVDPATGQHAQLSQVDIEGAVHGALVDRSSAAMLPLLIHIASTGDWQSVLAAAAGMQTQGGTDLLLMSEEILCTEAWARLDEAQVQVLGEGSYDLDAQLASARSRAMVCAHIPAGAAPADDGAPVVTDTPVLWVTGDGDPQDPPANLAAVPGQEPNAAIIVMPIANHTVGHLGCLPSIIGKFLDTGTADGIDTSCVARGANPNPAFRLN